MEVKLTSKCTILHINANKLVNLLIFSQYLRHHLQINYRGNRINTGGNNGNGFGTVNSLPAQFIFSHFQLQYFAIASKVNNRYKC